MVREESMQRQCEQSQRTLNYRSNWQSLAYGINDEWSTWTHIWHIRNEPSLEYTHQRNGFEKISDTFYDHDNESAQLVALIIYQFANYLFTLMYTGNHYIECTLTSLGKQKYLMKAKRARPLTVQSGLREFSQIFGDNAIERWCNIVENGAEGLWWDDTVRIRTL